MVLETYDREVKKSFSGGDFIAQRHLVHLLLGEGTLRPNNVFQNRYHNIPSHHFWCPSTSREC